MRVVWSAAQRRLEVRDGLLHALQAEEGDAEVILRVRIAWVRRHYGRQLIDGLVQSIPLEVEGPQEAGHLQRARGETLGGLELREGFLNAPLLEQDLGQVGRLTAGSFPCTMGFSTMRGRSSKANPAVRLLR